MSRGPGDSDQHRRTPLQCWSVRSRFLTYAFRGDFPSVTALQTATRIVNLRETSAVTVSLKLQAVPLLMPSPPARPSPGDKRRIVVIGVTIALVFGAVASWSLVQPGGYGQSRSGCIAITIPSSMGGALLHECGLRARAMCRNAFTDDDWLSLLARPQCRTAGLH